ncbi:MAG: hypothetical protein ACRC46_02640 [Thermoguttaceae bacterium]
MTTLKPHRKITAAVAAVAASLVAASLVHAADVPVGLDELQTAITTAKTTPTNPVVFSVSANQNITSVLDLNTLAEVTIKSSADKTTRIIAPTSSTTTQLLRQTTSGATLTLTDLTFTGGNLTSSNATTTPPIGGGVFVKDAGTFTATRIVFTKNSVAYTAAENNVTVSGGALALDSVNGANLTGTVFGRQYVSTGDTGAAFGNVAEDKGTGTGGVAAGGGAWVKSSVGVNFTSSEFYYNVAKSNSGTALGGGVFLDTANEANFAKTTFADNSATSKTGDAKGGAIFVLNSQGTVADPVANSKLINFSEARIYGNNATTQGSIAKGGGAFLENSSNITFDGAKLNGNIASAAPADGDPSLSSGTQAYGGGLHISKVENLSVAKAYIGYNTATATGTNAIAASGGGVFIDNQDAASKKIVFTESGFYANSVVSAKDASGGAISILGRSGTDGVLNLTKNEFRSNTVESKAASGSSYARGGAVSILGGGANLSNSLFVSNSVTSASKDAVNGGGAIYAENASGAAIDLNLTDTSFGYNEVKTTADNTTSGGGALQLNANNIDGMKLTLGATDKNWSGFIGNAIVAGTGKDAKTTGNSIDFKNDDGSGSMTARQIDVNVNIGAEGMLDIRDGMTGDALSKVVFNINADTVTNTGEWWLGGKSVFKNAATSFTLNRGVFGLYDGASIKFDAATRGTINIKDGATLALFTFTDEKDAALRNANIVFDANTSANGGGRLKIVMRDADYAVLSVGQAQERFFADDASKIVNLTEAQMQATQTNYSVNPLFKIDYVPGSDVNNCNKFVTMTRVSAASKFPNLTPGMSEFLDNYRGGCALITLVLNGSNPSVAPDIEIVSALNPGGIIGVSQQVFGAAMRSARASRIAPRVDVALPFQNAPARSLEDGRDKFRGQLRKKTKSQGFWVMPLYAHDAATDLKDGGYRYSYKSDQFGAAFGMDRTFGSYRFGFAGSAGGGTSKSSGDLVPTSGSTGFGSIYVYGDAAMPWNVELWGALGWLGSSATVEQTISGYKNSAAIPGGSFFIALAAERPVRAGSFLLTPSLELNYNLVYQQEFETNWINTLVSTTQSATGHAVTLPIGLRASCDLGLLEGVWTPSLAARMIPNLGTRELKYNVNTVGSIVPAPMRSVIVDSIGGDIGVGSHWRRRTFEGGLDYTFMFSEHFKTHQIAALMTWKF